MKIGFTGALFLIFLILKLTSVIAWSWWWVFSPFWAYVVLILVIVLGLCILRLLETPQERHIREARESIDALVKRLGK